MVIETVANERLIGRVLEEDAEGVRFASAALGELRIPRAKIRTMSPAAAAAVGATPVPGGGTTAGAAAGTPVPPAVATPPAKGALRAWLHLPDALTASLAAGVNAKSGVVDQRGYNLAITLGWQTPRNVFNAVFQYEYASAGPVVAANDFFFDSLLQHNLSEKSFLLVGERYRQDQVMAVDHELNLFVAPGRYLMKTPKFEFGLAAGLSQLWQDYGALAPGGADPAATSDLGVAAYQFLQYRVLPRVQLTQNNLFTKSLQNGEKYIYRFMVSANVGLTNRLSLVTAFAYGYDSEPSPGVKRSQNSLTTQLSYQF